MQNKPHLTAKQRIINLELKVKKLEMNLDAKCRKLNKMWDEIIKIKETINKLHS